MKNERPLAAGVRAALTHRRLAIVLWLAIAVPAGLVCTPLGRLTKLFDESPFRAALMKGWDSWGILAWQVLRPEAWGLIHALFLSTLVAVLLIQLFLTGGVLRTLMTGIPRPVFRRVVAESAALFKPTLWAAARYVFGLALWMGLFVAAPARLFGKLAEDRAPNGFWTSTRELWVLVAGLLVYYLVSLKFDLARIALAREEARNARGAYKLAKKRMKRARGRVLALALFWTVASIAIQVLFTNVGVRMNPQTGAGVFWLVVVRQIGFILSAMARVGFWASLIRFDEIRRDELAPLPHVPLAWEIPPAEPVPPPLPV
ncbi:MAG: hypothetical protein ACHQPI_12280 [Thermoanaerobaculia bacterium]